MTRLLLSVIVAALGIAWYLILPPAAIAVQSVAAITPPVRGVIHVHTRRSDGTGTPESVAAEAARAGLRFVVFTDHGDATRPPDPPVYRSGVLCIDAVEISTEGGHLVALGLPRAPYPLGGESRDVIEDVHRLGGLAIAAHPASARPSLQWGDWTSPIDGLEWLNGDSEWRDENLWSLARVLLTYPGRRAETLATLMDRPDALIQTWDRLTLHRPTIALAGSDAHARIGLRQVGEPYDNGASLPLPSYESVFRTFSVGVTNVSLDGGAEHDAAAILQAISRGHAFSTVDGLAGPGALSFSASSGAHRASMGESLDLDGPATLHVAVQAPPHAELVLLQDGIPIATVDAAQGLSHEATSDRAVYRVEVRVPGAPGQPPVPWLLSNPIYAGSAESPSPPSDGRRAPTQFDIQYDNGPTDGWTVETGAQSRGALDRLPIVGGSELGFRFGLGGAMSESPYAALALHARPEIATFDRLMFTARASRPMRVSVQLRAQNGTPADRWQRSVYLDKTPRQFTVYFDDMTPRGATSMRLPVLNRIGSVLFVIDTLNADTGSSGQFTIDDVKFAR